MKGKMLSLVLSSSVLLSVSLGGCGCLPCATGPLLMGTGLLATALLTPLVNTDDPNVPVDDPNEEGKPTPDPNECIVCPPGEDGQDGEDGVDGKDGEDGQDGKDGADGEDGADGQDGQDGEDGEDGEKGDKGEPGPTYFDIFIEEFWKGKYSPDWGIFPIDQVIIDEQPRLGKCWGDCAETGLIGFRLSIPEIYALNSDALVTMRLFLWKEDTCSKTSAKVEEPDYPCECNIETQLVFTVLAKRLQDGEPIEEDYGTVRWIAADAVDCGELLVIDLPLYADCPEGLGWGLLDPGDWLAVELETICADAYYTVLGAEFFSWESPDLDGSLSGATIHCEEIGCEFAPR